MHTSKAVRYAMFGPRYFAQGTTLTLNALYFLSKGLSGFLSDNIGFQMAFLAFAACNLLALPLLPAMFDKKAA